MKEKMRVGAIQAGMEVVDFHIGDPEEALAKVEENLERLVEQVRKAGAAGCDALALVEDTPGLHKWLAAHGERWPEVAPRSVERMLARLGEAAGEQGLYLVCCADNREEGNLYNTAFLLGRDGKEIGRYRKNDMPYSELGKRRRGGSFPVFERPDLGGVGLLICYDMVFPEPIRCLALGGADVVFVPTMGSASMAGGDLGRTAFRVRAADSFVYMVVAYRNAGSMVISPKGEILAEGGSEVDLVVADIDPFGGREGGNAFDWQEDVRVRLFRERAPEAFGILTDPQPPALTKLPNDDTPEEVTRRANGVLTAGEDRFNAARKLQEAGKREEAIRAFEQLRKEYPGSWIDRQAKARLEGLKG